ncbi:unnamed protein product [Caenorhabditis auriculariae]|uniref:EH domain-containing protein n=1 Tax=Caenorhabditis auriculariae TaxID=2777116 RepID=A0A8S1GXK0_9PELO|nr:unnamed protein product [Caenorhabditis auriculariae]
MLSGGGGLLPPALLDESRVPRFYVDAIVACGAATLSTPPNTALVYNLMVTSGLPRHVLSYIWSAVNRTLPGQLTRPEFYSCLALIALAQKKESLAALSTMDSLPIPFLNTVQAFPTNSNNVQSTSTNSPVTTKTKSSTASSFIPTSLLPLRRSTRKKEVDLISSKSPSVSVNSSPAKAAPSVAGQDLVGIEWNASESPNGEGRSPENAAVACWRETVHAVFLLFQEANDLFAKENDAVLVEIAATERGENYLRGLAIAFEIMNRVCRSAGVSLPSQSTTEAEACRKCWKRLSHLVKGPDFLESDASHRSCAICGQLSVNAVEYGGQCYDAACANLWVNSVSSLLPNLHLR